MRDNRPGWGCVHIEATIGRTSWATSVFSRRHDWLLVLPVKAAVRKEEGVEAGDAVDLILKVKG